VRKLRGNIGREDMPEPAIKSARAALPARPEPSPSSAGEYITLLAHFHRAEIARMAGWRDRIDRTTHWAITSAGAMLSLALSAPTAPHGVVLLAMVLVSLFWVIESRRYRFFDVYRARVRRLERHWFAPIFATDRPTDEDWLQELAADLSRPQFLMTLHEALERRLRRNYGWIFLILLSAWLLKTTAANPSRPTYSRSVRSFAEWFANDSLGPLPGWLIAAAVAGFYVWLVFMAFRRREPRGELAHGDVHV
jgi:uncharacterized membrane protein